MSRLIFLRRDSDANTAFILVAVIGLSFACLGGSFWAGLEFQTALYREAARIEAAKPKRASVPVPAANILQCPVSRAGIEEYYRTCRARERMAKIGGEK